MMNVYEKINRTMEAMKTFVIDGLNATDLKVRIGRYSIMTGCFEIVNNENFFNYNFYEKVNNFLKITGLSNYYELCQYNIFENNFDHADRRYLVRLKENLEISDLETLMSICKLKGLI